MPKKPAPAASEAMPNRPQTAIAPSRLASDPVATAIEAHKFAAAFEKQAFDSLLAAAAKATESGQKDVIAYIANFAPESIHKALLRLSAARKADEWPPEAKH